MINRYHFRDSQKIKNIYSYYYILTTQISKTSKQLQALSHLGNYIQVGMPELIQKHHNYNEWLLLDFSFCNNEKKQSSGYIPKRPDPIKGSASSAAPPCCCSWIFKWQERNIIIVKDKRVKCSENGSQILISVTYLTQIDHINHSVVSCDPSLVFSLLISRSSLAIFIHILPLLKFKTIIDVY